METESIRRLVTMKNVIVSLIAIAVLGYFIFPKTKVVSEKKDEFIKVHQSIAVLPFVNIGNDSEQAYFSDGFSEGILNSLAHLKGLKVCARASSFKFRGTDMDIKEVGRKLGVGVVLEGSVQHLGDRVKITAQLINVEDSAHLWSEQYDENRDDIFALQKRITSIITEKLGITLLDNGQQVVGKKATLNKGAFELYLKGRSFWNLRTPPDLKKGIDFFQQAIAIDPAYAAAYSGIADCYTALGYGSFLAPKEAFPKALEAATKALQLDSTLAEPHASLGFYKFYFDWNWAAAEEEFLVALAQNPNYEIGYDWYGYYLTAMKRYDEARIIFQKAEELDPLSVPIRTDMGFSYFYGGDYDLAIKELQASLQMNPKFPLTHIWLGRSYQGKKMYQEAIAEYKKTLEISVDWPVALAAIGNVYGVSGEKENAQKILDTLASLSSKKFVTSYGVALVYSGLGKRDLAFQWLNKAYDERSHWLVWLKSDPRWAILRSDKRYLELADRVGLNMKDSSALAEFGKKLAIYKAATENEKKRAQIELLDKEKLISQQQLQLSEQKLKSELFQKYILISGVFVLLLLGFIIFRNITLKQKNEAHRHDIVEKEFNLQQLESEKKKSELQQQATELEMQALRAQMNPHFIFNCLNSINRFILANRSEAAADYLTKFAKLIRIVLQQSGRSFIPLEDELYCLQVYMDLESLRFEIPFSYEINSDNINISALMVPPLLLQPFVENAIWHGLHPKENEKGKISIDLKLHNEVLDCSICDNGVGRVNSSALKEDNGNWKKSLGINLTRHRLQLFESSLKEEEARIVINDLTNETGQSAGTCVHIKIPVKSI